MMINTHQKFYLVLLRKNKFGQLINISQQALIMMNTVNIEFFYLEVWFIDQDNKALEIEDNVNLTLIIG